MKNRYEGINPKESLSKWENFYNEAIEGDIRCCMNIDSCQWNYRDKRVEFIEAEEIPEKAYHNYPEESLFNFSGDINLQYKKYEGERKKLLFIWNTIKKDLKGNGKLYLIFWSQRKDSIRVIEVSDITKDIIKYKKENDNMFSYEDFKKWIKKWNSQGRKMNY